MKKNNFIIEIIVGSVILIQYIALFIMIIVAANSDFIVPDAMITMFDTTIGLIMGYLGHSTLSRKRKEVDNEK